LGISQTTHDLYGLKPTFVQGTTFELANLSCMGMAHINGEIEGRAAQVSVKLARFHFSKSYQIP
jgi:hypothetical protein